MTRRPAPRGGGDAGLWWDRVARRFGRGEAQPAETNPSQTAFVLAGGGSRGAVQVGMLGALVDRGIRADRVYGASVGAVNAAAYCGDPTPAGMAELERVWRSLSGDLVFPRRRGHGPWTFFQQRPAVHPNTGLRRILEDGVRFERFEDAEIPLEVVATSLTDGRECWLSQGPVVDAVLASAAIPAMFPPVTIGGELLIDGGVVDNVPITRAIEAGARTIYVLLCGPLHYRPKPVRRPAEAVVTAFFVAVHARFARELAALPAGVQVVVFSGGGDPAADYRDFSATGELVAAGRAEVARVLDRDVHEDGQVVAAPDPAEHRRRSAGRPAPTVTGAPTAPTAVEAPTGVQATGVQATGALMPAAPTTPSRATAPTTPTALTTPTGATPPTGATTSSASETPTAPETPEGSAGAARPPGRAQRVSRPAGGMGRR